MHQLAVKLEQWPAAHIAVRAAELGSPLVGKKTIQRVLKNLGFLKLVPKAIPPLSEGVKWSQKYRNLDFSKVCFTDEAKILSLSQSLLNLLLKDWLFSYRSE